MWKKLFKYQLRNIFFLLLIGFCLTTYGCGLITMIIYGHIIKPTETWYFSRGFDKKIISSNIKTEISDSSNISSRSIRLDRMDNDTIKSYWIDLDTTIQNKNVVRIKIVDNKGFIMRFLDGWLVPEPDHKINYNSTSIYEDKKGKIRVKLDDSEHSIYHAGDMMGMHHFDIKTPKIIKKRPSFQMYWDGYNFEYSWITFDGENDDFYSFYQYSYGGDLIDSFYVSKKHEDLKISDNHYMEYDEWNVDYQLNINTGGNNYFYKIHKNPFGGLGQDKNISYLNPLLHTFEKNGYINTCFSHISFGRTIEAFDWIRDTETLKIVNETIKSIGYSKFISKQEFQMKKYGIKGENFVKFNFGYSLWDINDSLIYYFQKQSSPVYYKEFWSRRKNENIDTQVFNILKEIKNHYSDSSNHMKTNLINDTLKKIMTYDLTIQNIKDEDKKETILNYYNYLSKIGLNQSAYNLIFLNNETENVNIDRQKIFDELNTNKKTYLMNNKTYFLSPNKPKWIENE